MNNKLNLFSRITNIIWYILLIITAVFFFLGMSFYFKGTNEISRISLFEIQLEPENSLIPYFIPMAFITWSFVIYGFFLFKKLIHQFKKRLFFTDFAIQTLKRIGYVLIAYTFLNSIIKNILEHLVEQQTNIRNSDYTLSPFIYPLLLGFFFIILSEVFKVAKITKQENDLTI
ncbi:DUF2975 domain-containing protein [Flagellimonas onchidii]|uniref:DUF2975 domain-containing protein n=1 Tax=Flagellimonas onchidii TaxID=2562684 RepID=UPI0010A5CD14|nr:DUF2975 domain-containing protein [Allomuricauda onchidii]